MTADNPPEKVRELQRSLYMSAKRSKTRRFHALKHLVCRGDVLAEAWKRVKRNGGAAGVDGETLKAIEQEGVETFLQDLQRDLQVGGYRPRPVRRQYIPSRVREIRMHGLKGGPAQTSAGNRQRGR